VMSGGGRSSTGDEEGGAGGASFSPGSEVGASTTPVPAPHRRSSTSDEDSALESSSLARFLWRGTAPGTPTRCGPRALP
jgi:hypothetical protein